MGRIAWLHGPDLAEGGRALLYQVGVGLAFLGTVARGRPAPGQPGLPAADRRRGLRLRGARAQAGRPRRDGSLPLGDLSVAGIDWGDP